MNDLRIMQGSGTIKAWNICVVELWNCLQSTFLHIDTIIFTMVVFSFGL